MLNYISGEPDLDKVESSEEEISQELANDDDNPKGKLY